MNDIKIPGAAAAMQPVSKPENEASEKVKVKFEKFVQLVAMHDFSGVLKQHGNEDIILSTNLLTDLANAHEEVPDRSNRIPVFLIAGVIIGVIVTYIILRF